MLEQPNNITVAWPHAPTHKLGKAGTYFVTAATYQKIHYLKGSERLAVLQRGLLSVAQEFKWQMEAWAVFSNHYHFVAHSPDGEDTAESLSKMIAKLHKKMARWVNKLDHCEGRQVWHNFRETQLTFESSYLARLNYVHQNPVKHGLVAQAALYPWCSAAWFERAASPAQVKTIYNFDVNKPRVYDEFEPSPDWAVL